MGIVERLTILQTRLDEPKNDLERANNRIKELEQEVKEYETILEIGREREYHSKFLKDFQKEKGKNVFPDHDEIYKRYDDYKSRCEEKDKEIERLNKEKENLTNIVANKIIKDYDIETPLKDELNKARLKNIGLESENKRLNNIINEIYMFLSQYTITHTWQKIVIEDTIKYIEELKGSDKE